MDGCVRRELVRNFYVRPTGANRQMLPHSYLLVDLPVCFISWQMTLPIASRLLMNDPIKKVPIIVL